MSITRDTWNRVPLERICQISIGKTPSRAVPEYWGTGFPWLTISDMDQGRFLLHTKETITQLAVDRCNCKLVPSGTLLMSFKLSIGKLGFTAVPMYTNEAIAALSIRDRTRVDALFLYYALQSIDLTAGSDKAAKGNTLNTSKLKNLLIPLAPIEEQRRFVEILSRADRLLVQQTEALRQATHLFDALLHRAFSGQL